MAAGRLPRPGTQVGPCEGDCEHVDCLETMAMAMGLCSYCQKPIGFDVRFYRSPDAPLPACNHAACVEDAVEASRAQA